MRGVFALMILMSLFASSNAMAEWTAIGESDDKTVYVDLATIRVKGDKVKMWSMLDFKKAQKSYRDKFLSQKGQDEYDCEEEQYRMLASSMFSGNMGTGEVAWSDSIPTFWAPIPPGSVAEILWKVACGKK